MAVSGGVDSMVLWHLLRGAGFSDLVVVHVNHGLRGAESEADAAFVAEQAAALGTPCEIVRVEAKSHATERRISIETAARELRYAALARIARQRECHCVFLAHHADDQVETVLMHLCRGSGARGMAGMAAESTRVIEGVELQLARPLLEVSREEIERLAAERGIAHRHDASNDLTFCTRNRVRHELLPMLSAVFGREVRTSILRAAELAALDEAWAAECLAQTNLATEEGALRVAGLRALPEAARQRLLLSWLRARGVPDCGLAEVKRVVAVLMSDGRPAKASLPGDHQVRRRAGLLFIECPE